jgi:hypothetical protein
MAGYREAVEPGDRFKGGGHDPLPCVSRQVLANDIDRRDVDRRPVGREMSAERPETIGYRRHDSRGAQIVDRLVDVRENAIDRVAGTARCTGSATNGSARPSVARMISSGAI